MAGMSLGMLARLTSPAVSGLLGACAGLHPAHPQEGSAPSLLSNVLTAPMQPIRPHVFLPPSHRLGPAAGEQTGLRPPLTMVCRSACFSVMSQYLELRLRKLTNGFSSTLTWSPEIKFRECWFTRWRMPPLKSGAAGSCIRFRTGPTKALPCGPLGRWHRRAAMGQGGGTGPPSLPRPQNQCLARSPHPGSSTLLVGRNVYRPAGRRVPTLTKLCTRTPTMARIFFRSAPGASYDRTVGTQKESLSRERETGASGVGVVQANPHGNPKT